MQRSHRFLSPPLLPLLGALALATPALAANPDPLFNELRRLTSYNAQAPLEVKELRSERRGDVTITELPEAHHAFEFTDDVESSRDAMRRTGAFLNQQLGP
jgi:hypothetical protein